MAAIDQLDLTSLIKAWPGQYIPIQPTAIQLGFCCHPAKDLLSGGAAGGGKQVLTKEFMLFGRRKWRDVKDCGKTSGSNQLTQRIVPMIGQADSIQVGDYLYGSDGKPVEVLHKTVPEWRPFYRVTFDDGSYLDVSDNHNWTIWDLSKRAKGSKERGTFVATVETSWLIKQNLRYRSQRRFAIPLMSGPLEPENPAKPELDPYTLGYWLGNGCKQGSTLTCHSDDEKDIVANLKKQSGKTYKAKIYDPTAKRSKILLTGWIQQLTKLGWSSKMVDGGVKKYRVFDKSNIQVEWRTWSSKDRRALLAGLLDSDGTCHPNGYVQFDSITLSLAHLVRELLQSLGYKPTNVTTKKVRDNEQPLYRLQCSATEPVFFLERKNKGLKLSGFQKRQYRRYIESIEPIGHQEGVCFSVNSDDHLYVAGRQYVVTHNSEAMLAAALQYVEIPNYSAVVLRKSFADLSQPGALLDRAKEWLAPHLAAKTVKYIPQDHMFVFPSGAKVKFAYMGTKGAQDTVQGAEYHFVGIDEVTQHTKEDAMWCRSRMRRKEDSDIPLRFRCTANPGGIGHEWVKEYFSIKPNPIHDPKVGKLIQGHFFSDQPMFIGANPERPFIPARLIDNPYINKDYVHSLVNMDPVTKAQLLDGDWAASPSARFKRAWFTTRYKRQGDYLVFCTYSEDGQEHQRAVHIDQGQRFATVDIAASVKEGVAGEQFYTRGGSTQSAMPCWTVISTWSMIDKQLVLLDVKRVQVEAPDIFILMKQTAHEWNVRDFLVEDNGMGRPVIQVGLKEGLPIRPIWTTYDKIVNSYTSANLAKAGKIVFPHEDLQLPWLEAWESEIFSWMGFPEETSDQVDTMSTAGKEAQNYLFPGESIDAPGSLVPTTLNKPRFYPQARGPIHIPL